MDSDNFRFRFYGDGRDIFVDSFDGSSIFVLAVKSDSVDFGLGGDTFNSIFTTRFRLEKCSSLTPCLRIIFLIPGLWHLKSWIW